MNIKIVKYLKSTIGSLMTLQVSIEKSHYNDKFRYTTDLVLTEAYRKYEILLYRR